MSSPAQQGDPAPRERERRGLGRALSKMRTFLKKGDSSKRASTLSTMSTTSAGPSRAAPASAAAASAAPGAPAAPKSTPATAETSKEAQKEPGAGVKRIPRAQIYEERAQKLGERFGIDIKPSEWHSMEGDALRMERSIRIRVQRRCHLCQSSFGPAKTCPRCQHPRCKECVRYPPRRTEEERIQSRKNRAAILKDREHNAPIIPDWDPDSSKKKIVLTRPGKREGRDLVHRKPRQRVRRTCHLCQTLFKSGSKTCGDCGHARCTDCPRDPPKREKYPYGYPGDEYGENAVPHFRCHECKKAFPPNPPEGTECTACSHPICDDCPRLKPQKVEPEPDPEILKSVQQKLARLKVRD